jgi:DNA-binding CsgD family transcriptional regulator
MSACLSIQISSISKANSYEIKFFESEDWSPDAEKQLIARIQELLPLIRNVGRSFKIILNAEVTDLDQALFLIRKKINFRFEVNNQKLSIREIEVLDLIMQGYTNEDIAEKLFISYETVRSHRKHILHKTGAKNTAALINYYHQTFFDK